MIRISFEIKLPFTIKKKANVYVSSCHILDIHTQGATEKEAKDNLSEALTLFFLTCIERGTLDAALKECGFKAMKHPVKFPKDHRFIKIPIPFAVDSQRFSECHA